jgi:hypothetical protein
LDINTPGERAEAFPSEDLPHIFSDLFELALQNVAAGERP